MAMGGVPGPRIVHLDRTRVVHAGCPSCGLLPPRKFLGRSADTGQMLALTEWAAPWCHRCPHGEPCPAGAPLDRAPDATRCELCATRR